MNYEKPAISLSANAVSAIQDPFEKGIPNLDGDMTNPNPATVAAYAADE
jgi:hypothetical protein